MSPNWQAIADRIVVLGDRTDRSLSMHDWSEQSMLLLLRSYFTRVDPLQSHHSFDSASFCPWSEEPSVEQDDAISGRWYRSALHHEVGNRGTINLVREPIHLAKAPQVRSGEVTELTGPIAEFIENLLAASDTKPRNAKLTSSQQAAERYAERVKSITEVLKVILIDDDEGPSVWTIMEAPPFEEQPRERIIEVQIEVMQAMVTPLLGFHLVNLLELDPETKKTSVPHQGLVLFQR